MPKELQKTSSMAPRDVFESLFDDKFWFGGKSWLLRLDISETTDDVKVIADVPGIDAQDITIDVSGNRLTISGKTEREETSDEIPYRYERSVGEFRRVVSLPTRINENEVKAVCKNGVLTVTLPKLEKHSPKKSIKVTAL